MKLYRLTIILTILTFTSVFGQTNNTSCDCPKTQYTGTQADTAFHLANGKTIVLCGYKNPESDPVTFSEFILSACGQDTIIDFWGAVLTCQIKVNKDTLFVNEIQYLPTGMDFKFEETIWTTEKIFFSGQKLVRKRVINKQIRKYNQDEIQIVLNSYETAMQGLGDNKMEFVNKLFIATISGNKRARHYFLEFPSKCNVLDGADKEEYNDLVAMLELWDRQE